MIQILFIFATRFYILAHPILKQRIYDYIKNNPNVLDNSQSNNPTTNASTAYSNPEIISAPPNTIFNQIHLDSENISLSSYNTESDVITSSSDNKRGNDDSSDGDNLVLNLPVKKAKDCDFDSNLRESNPENLITNEICIKNFYSPEKVQSTEIFSLIVKIAAKYLYLDIYLDNMNYHLTKKAENLLIPLADSLVKFNKNHKSINYKLLGSIRDNFCRRKLLQRDSNLPFTLERFFERAHVTNKEKRELLELYAIKDQMELIYEKEKGTFKKSSYWCYFFDTITQLNEYYNQNLRKNLTPSLIHSILSSLEIEKNYIDYTEYFESENFLAYFIFDLLLGFHFGSYKKDSAIKLEEIQFKFLKPYINILFFLFLNEPRAIATLKNNDRMYQNFKQRIENNFQAKYKSILLTRSSLTKYEEIQEIKKFEFFDLSMANIEKLIEESSRLLNEHAIAFYKFSYDLLEQTLK